MLNDSKLSHQFWEDAVSTANYIHNIIPHKGNLNKIPYEILYKSKANYSNLHVFGCKVFFFVPKTLRNKFENNSLPGIFLGYSDNPSAYKILDISNNKIVFSRTVEFFEHTPGNFFLNKCKCSHDFNYFIPSHEIRGNNSYFLNDSYNSYYNNHLPLNNNKYHSQNSTTLKYYKDIQDNQIKRPNKTKKKNNNNNNNDK